MITVTFFMTMQVYNNGVITGAWRTCTHTCEEETLHQNFSKWIQEMNEEFKKETSSKNSNITLINIIR